MTPSTSAASLDNSVDDGRTVAAVEAGGTKFRAAVYREHELVAAVSQATAQGSSAGAPEPIAHVRIDTGDAGATLDAVADFLQGHDIDSLGIASFGPLVVDRSSPDYGSMAPTPKPGWTGAPVLGSLRARLGVPADIQTDVEAAAVAEHRLGAGIGLASVAYVTVGTGIGVGVAATGLGTGPVFRGRDHLELGHIFVDSEDIKGTCPFHGDCLEGRASGVAIADRTGVPADQLPESHPIWETVADELAQLACTLTWAFSPDRILFSGGVGANAHLEPRLRAATTRRLAGYSVSHATDDDLVATAGLGNDAGLVGAALLGASLL